MTDEQLVRRIDAHNFRIAALMSLCESQPDRRGEYRARARGFGASSGAAGRHALAFHGGGDGAGQRAFVMFSSARLPDGGKGV